MEDDIPQPPSALRIKLKLNARSSRPPLPPTHSNASSSTGGRKPAARAGATNFKSKSKKVAEEESDDDDEDELMLGDDDDIGLGDDGMGEEEDAEGEVEGGQSGAGANEDDELGSDGESRRSVSPSKMTARQRGRGDVDLQETLLALPMGESSFRVEFSSRAVSIRPVHPCLCHFIAVLGVISSFARSAVQS